MRTFHLLHGRLGRSTHSLLAAALALGLAACGSPAGAVGDPWSKPIANELGDGARIASVVGPATWLVPESNPETCQTPADRPAYVTGAVVVAIDEHDETGKGDRNNIYVQDADGLQNPYSGVMAYRPSFNPPDLHLAIGDVVDLRGKLQEYSGFFGYCRTIPEMSATMSFRYENGPLEPLVVDVTDLKDYAKARQWLGMLVRVENLRLRSDPNDSSSGRYNVDIDAGIAAPDQMIPNISNELYDIKTEGPAMALGQTFKSVTGVLTFAKTVHLAPRSPADFEE